MVVAGKLSASGGPLSVLTQLIIGEGVSRCPGNGKKFLFFRRIHNTVTHDAGQVTGSGGMLSLHLVAAVILIGENGIQSVGGDKERIGTSDFLRLGIHKAREPQNSLLAFLF